MTIEWIIALCVTAVVAVIGWTVTATLSMRMKAFETIKEDLIRMEANGQATATRVSVLENKYDTVLAAILRIEALLMKHLEK
jgi:hypothetical protein